MAVRRSIATVLVGALIVSLCASTAAQSSTKFKVRLSWSPIDNTNAANIAGSGSGTAELTGAKLSISGAFQGLRTPATIAQLHRGVAKGARGPVLADLTVTKAIGGTIGGSVDLTPSQVEDLQKGRLYVQIHSEKAPDGNLWGWLLP